MLLKAKKFLKFPINKVNSSTTRFRQLFERRLARRNPIKFTLQRKNSFFYFFFLVIRDTLI